MTTATKKAFGSVGCLHTADSHEDVKLCSIEAKAAIAEVGFGVKEICLASDSLPFTDTLAYLNLTTLEGEKMCVEISVKGFCPVGSSRSFGTFIKHFWVPSTLHSIVWMFLQYKLH
ncbi:unnamed protein product [Schistosoma rodhaini]|nr:unnamed protein product [Schistosoma rodhaini]